MKKIHMFAVALVVLASATVRTSVAMPLVIDAESDINQAIKAERNPRLKSPSYQPGAVNAKIGSFVLTARADQPIAIVSLSVEMGANGPEFGNLRLSVGDKQIGATQPVLSSGSVYSFTATSPLIIPAGDSIRVDAHADVLASATLGAKPALTNLYGCEGVGMISGVSAVCNQVVGQEVKIVPHN